MSILEPVREEPRLVNSDMMMVSPRPPVVSDPDNEQRPEPVEPVTSGNGPNPFASEHVKQTPHNPDISWTSNRYLIVFQGR